MKVLTKTEGVKFHIIAFYTKTTSIISVCDTCSQDYGSWLLFQNYDLVVQNSSKINLKSNHSIMTKMFMIMLKKIKRLSAENALHISLCKYE